MVLRGHGLTRHTSILNQAKKQSSQLYKIKDCLGTPERGTIESRATLEELVKQLEADKQRRFVSDSEYAWLLKACQALRAPDIGKRIHEAIVKAGLQNRVFLGNHLVHMYGKCGNLEDAWMLFESMPYKNLHTWTTMIGICAEKHMFEFAMERFREMQQDGWKPDEVACLAAVTACERPRALADGKLLHGLVIEGGFQFHTSLGNALISMYNSCGSLEDAKKVFEAIPEKNFITWTAIIAAYAEKSCWQAFQLFQQMQLAGVKPTYVTFVTLIQACVDPEAFVVGRLVHGWSAESGVDADNIVSNALITMYAKCGALEDSKGVFDRMESRDMISWNSLITEMAQLGFSDKVAQLYRLMQADGFKPDRVTFLSLLSTSESLPRAKVLHAQLTESGIPWDVALGTCLLSMYSKCESLEDTHSVFEMLPEKNVISWNVMLTAYAQHGLTDRTLQSIRAMQLEGFSPDNVTCVSGLNVCAGPEHLSIGKRVHGWVIEGGYEGDVVLGNALLNMYSRCGRLKDAETMFRTMAQQNVVTWTAMLAAYQEHDQHQKAVLLFHEMQLMGIPPNCITFAEALSAFVGPEQLRAGKLAHSCIVESGNDTDFVVGSALVAMYGRCGTPEDAKRCYDSMLRRNMITSSAMIAVYVDHGRNREAFHVFREMQLCGIKPTSITFMTVLSACGNLADLQEGKKLHSHVLEAGMDRDTAVANALATMYGKCGSMVESMAIFESRRENNMISWNVVITAYAQHGHAREALELFHRMQQESVKPDEITFVSLLSVCAHAGLLEEGVHCYAGLRDYDIAPNPDHNSCVIDLLARAGKLYEAEVFIGSLPVQPSSTAWMSLLGSCKSQGDMELGRRSAERVMQLNPKASAAHIMLSSMYRERTGTE